MKDPNPHDDANTKGSWFLGIRFNKLTLTVTVIIGVCVIAVPILYSRYSDSSISPEAADDLSEAAGDLSKETKETAQREAPRKPTPSSSNPELPCDGPMRSVCDCDGEASDFSDSQRDLAEDFINARKQDYDNEIETEKIVNLAWPARGVIPEIPELSRERKSKKIRVENVYSGKKGRLILKVTDEQEREYLKINAVLRKVEQLKQAHGLTCRLAHLNYEFLGAWFELVD